MATGDEHRSNEEIDAAIRERIEALGGGRLADELKAQGQSVVFLDGDNILRESPDGTRETLGRLGEDLRETN